MCACVRACVRASVRACVRACARACVRARELACVRLWMIPFDIPFHKVILPLASSKLSLHESVIPDFFTELVVFHGIP